MSFCAHAQEESSVIQQQGTHYIDLKLHALDKYNDHLQQQQQRLINKLKRREKHFANKLKNTDSAAYARYTHQQLSYDSIGRLMNADSVTIAAKTPKRKEPLIDSLKGVAALVQSQPNVPGAPQVPGYNAELAKTQGELNYHSYINDLITQRTSYLKGVASHGNIPGISGIEQQVFYGKAKMNVYKEMEEDPSKAEDKALEYLEGAPGFEKNMNNVTAGPNSMQSLSGNVSASDLEKMGFQTKSQLQSSLQSKFGNNLGGVAQQMTSQINQFQQQANGITSGISNAKQTMQSAKQLKHFNIQKPSFKINPMAELPFWKRITKQYNFQTTRPTIDGKPAMLNLSAMAGYQQNPKLTYGLGIAYSIGLGQSWTNVHLSFQGLGLRSYVNWQWQYGIGVYGGYERMYKQAVFVGNTQIPTIDTTPTVHNTSTYTESLLIGLTKSYRINNKWNGQLQVLYDIWWQQEGLRSPIIIRFSTIKI
ncbi:MAG TPA: hypothetical protein VN721_06510 [Flavipsychrobacter sp.]|nr:hypothetical protein [Flavipsychrobacter sp.]